MNDFDDWFKNLDLRHYTIRDIAFIAYGRGRVDEQSETPTGLPGVTSGDIYRQMTERWDDLDTVSLAYALEDWFNNPDRDVPVKPTMSEADARHAAAARSGAQGMKSALTSDEIRTARRIRELEAERDAHLLEDLNLDNLSDYETWFKVHGSERTVKHQIHPLAEATVHELYTMFRARLLDELRQAGVIGIKRIES